MKKTFPTNTRPVMKPDKIPLSLSADNREKSSGIPGLLRNRFTRVQMAQLAAGDYMINDEIVIERKTKEDFVQSLTDGRLFAQCAKLRKTGMIPMFIVEGNPYKTAHHISPTAIKGALLSINLTWQIPIIKSLGKEDTANIIVMAAQQELNALYFVRKSGRKPKKRQNQQHYFLQGLPGVGPVLAHKLLGHFNTIEKIIRADKATLSKVEGIGKKKAERLFGFFRERMD